MAKVSLKDENGKFYFGWWIVIIGFILMTFGYSCIVSVAGVFMLPVTTDLGISIGDFAIWMTISALTAAIFLLVIQKQVTEKKIKPLMVISAACGVIGMVGFSRATELTHFYIFAILLGICFSGLTSMPCTILVNNWFGSKVKGVALSLVFGGTTIGCMIMIPILNYITQTMGWRTAYIVIAIFLAICIPLVLIFMVYSPAKKGIARMGETEDESSVKDVVKPGILFKDARKKASTWLMLITGVLIVIASVNILAHTQPFLELSGYSSLFASNIVSGMIGLLMVGSIVMGAICDRGKLHLVAIITAVLFAIAFIAQIFVPVIGVVAIVILVIGYGFGCPAVNVVSPLLANFMFGEKDLGVIITWINMFIAFGGAIGTAVIAAILNATGSYTIPFIFCAGILLLAGIIRGIVTTKKFKFNIADAQEPSGAPEPAAK